MDLIEIEQETGVCRLTADEIAMLLNAINESSQALEDWEYSTRMGFERAAVDKLRQSLKDMLTSIDTTSS
ncbi:MAG: hypothetical protein JJU36_14660 [Phycisphaeraceae bacterium]|nr:hypothetical protein [Phycisphaeraceae bacterium]